MKTKLLSLILTAALNFTAFSQNISFEFSEGYTLGEINNQQGWTYWGSIGPNTAQIVNTTATHGTNSAEVSSTNSTNDGGIRKSFVGHTKTAVSFDYKISALNGSDYFMIIGENQSDVAGAFVIDYDTGKINIYDATLEEVIETPFTITPDTWTNFKMIVDLATHSVEYFINNTSVGSKPFSTSVTAVSVADFAYDDYGSGFTVDNIKISDAALSTTDENHTKQIVIYPNPTSDFINIKNEDRINSVEIFDASGKLVAKDRTGKKHVPVSFLQNGLYILKVSTDQSVYTKKFNKK